MMLTEEVLDLAALNAPIQCQDLGIIGEPDVSCPEEATWVASYTCGHCEPLCSAHKAMSDPIGLTLGHDRFCDCGFQAKFETIKWHRL